MLSQTAQYALRAMVYIVQQGEDRFILAREIAEETDVPKQYLSSILREAVRAGLLTSTRGKGGGFKLKHSAKKIKLVDVLRPFDDVAARTGCPFGQPECSDLNPCVFHNHWKPVSEAYQTMINKTSLADIKYEALVKLGKPAKTRRKKAKKR